MALNMKRMQELSILAIAVMLVQIGLSKYVYPFFGKTTQQLFAITPTGAVTSPTIGNKVLGYLSGIIPFDLGVFGNWVSIFIGALILLIAGYWVYDQRKIVGISIPQGKNQTQRLFAILAYGSIILYAVLLILKRDSVATLGIPLAIGVAINYFVIAFIVTSLAKLPTFKFLRI